jgi:hypothetical protein
MYSLRVSHAHSRVIAGGALAVAIAVSACSSPKATPAPDRAAAPQLWGDLKPIVSVKELMRDMLDPASDFVFDSISTVQTRNGTVEKLPKTDEDWDRLRIGAVTLAEGAYLLKIPRPFAPPGDENNSTGPDPEELSPAQIKAKLEKDPVLWNAKIEALRNVALETLDAVKRRDVDALFQAGADLDVACEECHLEYWYPGDRDMVLRERRGRVTLEKPQASGTSR